MLSVLPFRRIRAQPAPCATRVSGVPLTWIPSAVKSVSDLPVIRAIPSMGYLEVMTCG